MTDFISLQGEVIALIEDLDLEFMGISESDLDIIPYFTMGWCIFVSNKNLLVYRLTISLWFSSKYPEVAS